MQVACRIQLVKSMQKVSLCIYKTRYCINSIGAHLPIGAIASAPSVFDGSLEVTMVVLGPPEDLCRLAARAMCPWPCEKALPVLPRLLLWTAIL